MPKKYELYYSGTGVGQAREIERSGYVFTRGCSTEVPKAVFDELKGEEGFDNPSPSSSPDRED